MITTATPNITVDPEVQQLIRPLQTDERELLEQSLRAEGCRDHLVVWEETGTLLDGHNRFDICTKLGIQFRTTTLSFATKDDAILWVIENQLGRRNLADIDRIALAAKREPLIRARAAANQGARTDLVQNSAGGSEGGRTRDVAAAAAGVSHDTYTKGKKVLEQGIPLLVDAVREGDTSIHAASAIADLPPDEQVEAVADGNITEVAKSLRQNRRQQNTGNNEWGTPRKYVDAVRTVLGTIDVDPATHEAAQARIQATTAYTRDDDGLSKPWRGTVFLNPPYSNTLIRRFTNKLVEEFEAGNVTSAIFLVNNETDAAWFQFAAQHATCICFPKGRVQFLRSDGSPSKSGPLQGQAILYFGRDAAKFIEVFGEFGVIVATAIDTEEPVND